MPASLSYPGVYIEEMPSGVRTITGVATSTTAFIGRAQRGPVNTATVINSFADYERKFGGLSLKSAMSFAVRDFFLNGGGQAVIGRLYRPEGGGTKKSVLPVDNITLEAAHEGKWGNTLRARIDHNVSAEVALSQGLLEENLFNLFLRDTNTGITEEHRNVSVVDGPRQVDKVLESYSDLVRVSGALPSTRPALSTAPQPGEDPWGDNIPSTNETVSAEAADDDQLQFPDYIDSGFDNSKLGLYLLKQTDIYNLLCLPPEWDTDTDPGYPAGLISAASTLCEQERAMLLLDPPRNWRNKELAKAGINAGVGTNSKNTAIFYPRIKQPNPLRDNQIEEFVPCGVIAGVMARTDSQRGVWKAPAGIEATLRGVPELAVKLTDDENGELNQLGVNCLRTFPVIGRVAWGSRTLRGADILASEWKYIPVRRLALFIEETLYRGTQWVVFEPNDEPLWSSIRLNIGAFMQNLFRQGAFQGNTPREAYLVKCDSETTIQNDINLGVVNIIVGFAPLKPAEFVIIKIQQLSGQIQT